MNHDPLLDPKNDPVREALRGRPKGEMSAYFTARLMRNLPAKGGRPPARVALDIYWIACAAATLYLLRDSAALPWIVAPAVPLSFAAVLWPQGLRRVAGVFTPFLRS